MQINVTLPDEALSLDSESEVLLFDEIGQNNPSCALGGHAADVESGVVVFFPNWTREKLIASAQRTLAAWNAVGV